MGKTKRILVIQKDKYQKVDINQVTAYCIHSKNTKKNLTSLLKKYETIFDGTLGTWKGSPYDIHL